ncbi:MAG: PIN domain-containing protein [Acidobacteria bacterium]|nr:PIN domain-containing protein [Acidobacteriota bacterium]
MIAVDTNVLVYAHRKDSPWHERASARMAELAEGTAHWAIPAACLHEFLAIVTHPRIYRPPTPLPLALDQVDAWLESPSVVTLTESDGYWTALRGMLERSKAAGGGVHDARIAALCAHHGVNELWTADRDFSRFAGLKTINPLVG